MVNSDTDRCGICRGVEADLNISFHGENIDVEASVCIDCYTAAHQLIEPALEEEIGDDSPGDAP